MGCVKIGGDARSVVRLARDVLLSRVLRVATLRTENAVRVVQLRGGETVSYRLNRGDLQGIREVLMDEIYRLPFVLSPRVVVDLGANIGLTSVYLARHHRPEFLLAVEPDPLNAALARVNLEPIGGHVLEAAVGARDGTAKFTARRDSNLGMVDPGGGGDPVRVVSMNSVLALTPQHRIDLLKIDIEGGEQELLSGELSWLSAVDSIIAEFHPDRVDYDGLIGVLREHGFRYIPAGSAWAGSMDAVVREPG